MYINDIPFGNVYISLIEDYVYFLKVDLRLAVASVRSFLAPFRTTVKRAYNKGLIRQYPFLDLTPEKEVTKRRYLSSEELERLMETDFKRKSANYIRDMFLFATFTGLSYSDLKNLQHNNMQQQADGSKWIVLNSKKTGVASCIPLLGIPLQILEKFYETTCRTNNLQQADSMFPRTWQVVFLSDKTSFVSQKPNLPSLPVGAFSSKVGNLKKNEAFLTINLEAV